MNPAVARPLAVLALLASVVVALPAGAGTAGSPALTATTVLSSTRSGYVDVELPVDARLSPRFGGNPDVGFNGPGRMLGVWLRPLDPTSNDSLEALRLPRFLGAATQTTGGTVEPAPRCDYSETGGATCTTPTPKAIVLHRGRYRLSVLTDGQPVTVTLRLRGPAAGTTRLRAAHGLGSAQMPLPARESLGSTMVTYGATGPLGGPLLTFVMATAKATGTQVDGASVCERRDPADAPPFGYGPVCPGGASGGYQYRVGQHSIGVFGAFVTTDATAADGVGLGGSFTNDQGVTLGQTLGVWLRQP
jgi:hypothetical protein